MGVGFAHVFGVVAGSAVVVGKGDQAQRRLCVEYKFADSCIDILKLLRVCRPVGRGKEEFPEKLFGTLGDKLGIAERFVVAGVVDECGEVEQYLVDGEFVEVVGEGLDGELCASLEGPEGQVDEGRRFVGALEEADLGTAPARLCEVVGVRGLLPLQPRECRLAVQLREGCRCRDERLAHYLKLI